MGKRKQPEIPQEALDLLEESGLSWEIEMGSKHFKVKVEGHLAAIYPKIAPTQGKNNRGDKNVVSAIRHKIWHIKNGGQGR